MVFQEIFTYIYIYMSMREAEELCDCMHLIHALYQHSHSITLFGNKLIGYTQKMGLTIFGIYNT